MSDWVGGTVPSGNTFAVLRNTLAFPNDRALRILGFSAQVACIDNASTCFQIRVYGPSSSGAAVFTTGPIIVGTSGWKGKRRMSAAQSTEYPRISSTDTVFIAIDHICQQKADANKRLRFVLRLDVSLGDEEFTGACPSKLSLGEVDGSGTTYSMYATRIGVNASETPENRTSNSNECVSGSRDMDAATFGLASTIGLDCWEPCSLQAKLSHRCKHCLNSNVVAVLSNQHSSVVDNAHRASEGGEDTVLSPALALGKVRTPSSERVESQSKRSLAD